MKRRVVLLLVLILCCVIGVHSFADDGSEREIGLILDSFEHGYLEEDLDLIASLMSDNGYAMVMRRQVDPGTALVLGKAQILQAIGRRFQQVEYREHRHTERQIRVDGHLATSLSTIVDRMADGTRRESTTYHIYAREADGWRVVFTSDVAPGR